MLEILRTLRANYRCVVSSAGRKLALPAGAHAMRLGMGECRCMSNKSETSTERRAREIFESEGRKGVTWNLVAPEDRKPGVVTQIMLSETAKERYRQLAKKELGL